MAQTRTYQVTERGGSTPGSLTMSVSAEGADVREVSVPPATTNKEIDLDFPYASLKGLLMSATGVADNTTITVKTNSTGAPGDTITFKTPGGVFYATDANGAAIGTNPFSADVTRLYVSNPDTTNTAAFRASLLFDPTP